jgi:hypothetical protein
MDKAFMVIILITGLLVFWSTPAIAVSGSGNWIDTTSYCGTGVCTVLTTNHKMYANFSYYTSGNTKVAYYQKMGGTLYPTNSLCPPHWNKGDTYYTDANGSYSMRGWVVAGAVCSQDSDCHAYSSDYDHVLYALGTSAHFGGFTSWTTRCIPVASKQRFINLGF